METIVLLIHLLLALALILTVLLQRSEGGGLGIGGGGGGVMSGRPPTTPMAKFTWMLAIAFICTSLILTYFATQNASDASVIDREGIPEELQDDQGGVALPPTLDGPLTPPPTGGDGSGPAVPPPAQ